MHQSCPGVLFLLDSQPSIHLPRSVYLSAMKMPRPGLMRFSFPAKKSSLHRRVLPPRRSAARSVSFVNAGVCIIFRSTKNTKNHEGHNVVFFVSDFVFFVLLLF